MTEATLTVTSQDELLQLFGPRDQHLRKLRLLFDVMVTHRNGRIRIAGEEAGVTKAMRTLEKLLSRVHKQGAINSQDVEAVAIEEGATVDCKPGIGGDGTSIVAGSGHGLGHSPGNGNGSAAGNGQSQTKAKVSGRDDIAIQHAGRKVRPRTEGQAKYVEAIREHDLTFATGPAGCGKTYLAVATAVEALKSGQVRKIVLVRPAVEAGESLGFLPGDLRAKLNPYLRPLLDALGEMVDYDQAREFMEQEVIEVIPLAYMRGRTLNDAFIILDEAQNTTIAQMKMFLTRMGERSKMVVSGDATQLDLPRGVTSGLRDAIRRLGRIKAIAMVRLSGEDIVRHRLVQRIVEAYEETDEMAAPPRARRGSVRMMGNDSAANRANGEGPLDR